MIKMVIQGEPKPLQRHRTAIVQGKTKHYDSQKKKKHFTSCQMLAEKKNGNWLFDETPKPSKNGYALTVKFYMYRPPAMNKFSEERLNQTPHTQKPDIDNLLKYIFDCGNKILWYDDAEVCAIENVVKCWSHIPRTEIIINELVY